MGVKELYEAEEFREVGGLPSDYDGMLEELSVQVQAEIAKCNTAKSKRTAMLKGKHVVMRSCFEQTVKLVQNPKVASMLELIKTAYDDLVLQLFSEAKETNAPNATKADEENPGLSQLMDMVEKAEHKTVQLAGEKEKMERSFKAEREELLAQVQALEAENKKCLDALIRQAKSASSPTRALKPGATTSGSPGSSIVLTESVSPGSSRPPKAATYGPNSPIPGKSIVFPHHHSCRTRGRSCGGRRSK